MITKKPQTILESKRTEVKNIITKIILERDFDIPDSFIKYIDASMFVSCLSVDDLDSSTIEDFVYKIYPTLGDKQYLSVYLLLSIFHKHYYTHLFPQTMVAKVLKNSNVETDTAVDCVRDIIKNKIYVEPCIVHALLTKIVGRFWFCRRWSFICNALEGIVRRWLDLTREEAEYILPTLYDIVPSRIVTKVGWDSRETLYRNGLKEFIYHDAFISDMYTYMDTYIIHECTHEIPESLIRALYMVDDRVATNLSEQEKFFVHRIKRLIQKSVMLNANNVNNIYWASVDNADTLLLNIASSNVPIRDISIFANRVHIHSINDSIIQMMIDNGVFIQTLLPYMSDIKKFIDAIFSFETFHKFVYSDNDSDIMNIENASSNEYLLDILSIDCDISVNGKSLPFIDYVIQNNVIQDNMIALTVEHAILSNRELFMSLDTDTIDILMTGKDKSVYRRYPATITSSIYETLTQSEIIGMIIENPDVAKYIPSRYIDEQTILTSMKINMRKFIPICHSIIEPIRSEFILTMITEHGCGYGYIPDVQTEIQMDALVEAIVKDKHEKDEEFYISYFGEK